MLATVSGVARFLIIDTAGSERGEIDDDRPMIGAGETVDVPGEGRATVVEVYDEEGADNLAATLVVDLELE